MISPEPATLQSILVIGGARSGKSRFGQGLAQDSGRDPVLIATAEPGDEEMRARIAQHRLERNALWQVVEEPIALVDAVLRLASPRRILVVDCLTLWLSNLMLSGRDYSAEGERLTQCLATLKGPAIFISNEVGSGIVPENALARAFSDAQGRLNQNLAAAADQVVLIVAGLPLLLKPYGATNRPL